MNEEGITFISDIFEDLVVAGHGCSCTLITPEMTVVAKMLRVPV